MRKKPKHSKHPNSNDKADVDDLNFGKCEKKIKKALLKVGF